MPSFQRAIVIQKHMGGEIYWDTRYNCFRVMRSGSLSLTRYIADYIKIPHI